VKKSILGELIDRKLLLKEAAQQGIQVEPEELALELRKYKSNYTELSFQKMLADKGFTPEEWADLKKENLLIQKYLQSAMGNAEISQEEMQKYYQEHPGEFEIPESVHVRQIVTNTKDKAEAILRRLTQGENFAKLASDLSLSPDREMGGDLGFIRRGTFPREFEICFSMRPGEISPIIPSLYGFHIFKILEKAPPRILEFAEVEVRIRDILQGRRREEFVRKQIESLRAKVVVEINERVLERVEI
jgi:parvulin-like peptidyl-prolyl isomerase